ncbi:MAG: hypothetical protein ACXVYB_05390 [Arthrobacter sp.]
MTPPLTPSGPAAMPVHASELWKPVLLRALTALMFGAVTVFWAAPVVSGMGWSGGIYLLLTGLALMWSTRKGGAGEQAPGRFLTFGAFFMAVYGLILPFLVTDSIFGVFSAVALGLVGVAELYCGMTMRGRHVLARDWIASGLIGVGTAVALPFFIGLGAHALLGVAGGGAIISGVLWTLSALTLRHDARSVSAEAVN